MSDGLNEQRAVRIAELMQQFRTLQTFLVNVKIEIPTPDQYHAFGFKVLRQCLDEAQAILSIPYHPSIEPWQQVEPETQKAELQRIILDATARRFRAQKICLRATAAQRWTARRNNLLRGHVPHAVNMGQLEALDQTLRSDLAAITDQRVFLDLENEDIRAGRWLDEDPDVAAVVMWANSLR
ncbi:MAG: hypothetical protein M1817_003440 [Caeruleum heppii]|nr:MAG: hypothetical protein M1817_003440 [Caeruleum heppii]